MTGEWTLVLANEPILKTRDKGGTLQHSIRKRERNLSHIFFDPTPSLCTYLIDYLLTFNLSEFYNRLLSALWVRYLVVPTISMLGER